MQEALDAMVSDNAVTVTEVAVKYWPKNSNLYYVFEPKSVESTTGFIIYPGALLDPRSYAPTAHEIAAEGFLTIIVSMPFDLAPFGSDRANKILTLPEYDGIKKWAIGGHSVGGSFACKYAKDYTDNVDGVVLWASYPSESFRIDNTNLKVICIYGTHNPDCNADEIEENKPFLPSDTIYVEIEGGNHTQFGYYDTSPDPVQKGDDNATITREEQQAIIIQSTVDLLSQL